ncbi:MAG: FixH family protein [Byssovorax sp.]
MRQVIAVGLALSWLVLGCSGESSGGIGGGADVVFPAEPLTTLKTDHGALTLEVRTAPQQPPARGLSTVELVATDAAGKPVDGLELAVQPWMPEMGHGASTKPSIEAKGDGHYVVSHVACVMPGRWELRTSIAGAVHDSATVTFQIH